MKNYKLVLCTLIMSLLFYVNGFCRGLLSDTIYVINNPSQNSSVIVNKSGKVLLKTIDPDNEYLSIVYDLYTDEPAFLSKTYLGEELKEVKYDDYAYHTPSYRIVYYDLEGKPLDLGINDASGYNAAWNEYLLVGSESGTYLYNSKEKTMNKTLLRNFDAVGDKLVLSNSQWNDGERRMEIYDRNANQLKIINDYAYSYKAKINEKEYDLVAMPVKDLKDMTIKINGKTYKTTEEENKTLYNYLDSNGDLYFDEPVENEVYGGESDIVDFISGNIHFKYDMAKREYVSTPSEISEEEAKKIIEESTKRPYDRGNEDDENIVKLQEKYKDEDHAWVEKHTYKDINLYTVMYGGEFIEAGTENEKYVEYIDLYDDKLELKIEHNESIDMNMVEYGYILVGKDLYDTKLEKLMSFDDEIRFNILKKDDRIYFVDIYDRDYNQRENMTIYDESFKPIISGITEITLYTSSDNMFLTGSDTTIMYDKDLNPIKDLGGKYIIEDYYDVDYMVFIDMDTGRYGIMDRDANILVKNLKYVGNLNDEYFVYQNGFRYGIMDYKGKEIVSLSIFGTMKEDARLSDYDSDEILE